MFQIGVSFYLLYTQVGLAFVAGAVFTIILIPINKYIASKIGKSFIYISLNISIDTVCL
jgi:ATP-binding cassette subfamily C (CFTR/MRP) protein 10